MGTTFVGMVIFAGVGYCVYMGLEANFEVHEASGIYVSIDIWAFTFSSSLPASQLTLVGFSATFKNLFFYPMNFEGHVLTNEYSARNHFYVSGTASIDGRGTSRYLQDINFIVPVEQQDCHHLRSVDHWRTSFTLTRDMRCPMYVGRHATLLLFSAD